MDKSMTKQDIYNSVRCKVLEMRRANNDIISSMQDLPKLPKRAGWVGHKFDRDEQKIYYTRGGKLVAVSCLITGALSLV